MLFWSSNDLWAGAPGASIGVSTEGPSLRKITSGLILVKFKSGISDDTIESVLQRIGLVVLESFTHTNISVIKVIDENRPIEDVVKELNESGIVAYAEPDYGARINDRANDP